MYVLGLLYVFAHMSREVAGGQAVGGRVKSAVYVAPLPTPPSPPTSPRIRKATPTPKPYINSLYG